MNLFVSRPHPVEPGLAGPEADAPTPPRTKAQNRIDGDLIGVKSSRPRLCDRGANVESSCFE
jgi:hypothetical protein